MSVSQFNTWLTLTREQVLTPAESIINDASKHTYTIGKMMANRPGYTIRGGQYIVDKIMLDNRNSFRFYQPGENRNPGRSNVLQTVTYPYRFAESDIAYTDAEQMLNGGGDQLLAFKNFRWHLKQQASADHWNGIESNLWRRPDSTNMESTSVATGLPYSIPAFITESSTYLPPASVWSGATIGNVSATAQANWRNQESTYDATNPYGSSGLFAAFDDMFLSLRWEKPPTRQEYFTDSNLSRLMVFTNKDGVKIYMQGLREGNDQFRAGPQDPAYGKPIFKGIPIDWASQLDTELLDQTATAYSGTAYPTGSPRFFFVDGNTLFPVFHAERFMYEKGPIDGGYNQHDTYALFYVSWYNLICLSRRRQGIIYPTR